MVKIFELLPFFNEFELLAMRITLLSEAVERFVISEGDRTFQGEEKLSLLAASERPDDLVSIFIHLPDGVDPWERERRQRDALLDEVAKYADSQDLILSCDADEIIDPNSLVRIADSTSVGPVALGMEHYYYGLDWMDAGLWRKARAFRLRDAPSSLSAFRLNSNLPILESCGWHISYWGSPVRRMQKVEAYSHAENRQGAGRERIANGHLTGTGPNGEKLIRVSRTNLPSEALAHLTESD